MPNEKDEESALAQSYQLAEFPEEDVPMEELL